MDDIRKVKQSHSKNPQNQFFSHHYIMTVRKKDSERVP